MAIRNKSRKRNGKRQIGVSGDNNTFDPGEYIPLSSRLKESNLHKLMDDHIYDFGALRECMPLWRVNNVNYNL